MRGGRTKRKPQPNRLSDFHLPAPTGGINRSTAGAQMAPTDCFHLGNMVMSELGLRVRLGTREWRTVGDSLAVRTLVPFTGSNSALNKLFAVNRQRIVDVTEAGLSEPEVKFTFPLYSTNPIIGHGNAVNFVTSAGHFLAYADDANGYHLYTESTGNWTKVNFGGGAGEVSNGNPGTFAFVCAFKGFLFFVQRDTDIAWYLPLSAITGAATAFPLARQFKAGGGLRGIYNLTFDAGAGMDDHLVFISDGGDVAIYAGTDPSDASAFGLVGVWNVGAIPAGRRIAFEVAGDVLIITAGGVVPLSKLKSGGFIEDPALYTTQRVSTLFNSYFPLYKDNAGWQMCVHPEEDALLVLVPRAPGQAHTPLAMSLGGQRPWSLFDDYPINCAAVFGGKFFLGTHDGRVMVGDGYRDNVSFADSDDYDRINFGLLTSFQNFGSTRTKQVRQVQPLFESEGALPAWEAGARYDFDISDVDDTTATPGSLASAWGSGLWGSATWSGDFNVSYSPSGAVGMGKHAALEVKGSANSRTILVGVDVIYEEGGLL